MIFCKKKCWHQQNQEILALKAMFSKTKFLAVLTGFTQRTILLFPTSKWTSQKSSQINLTHFRSMFPFFNLWKHQKISDFLVIFRGYNLKCINFHCLKSVHIRNFSGPYFPEFGLNTERCVFLHIQSECGKIWTRKNPNTDTLHAVLVDHRSFVNK